MTTDDGQTELFRMLLMILPDPDVPLDAVQLNVVEGKFELSWIFGDVPEQIS